MAVPFRSLDDALANDASNGSMTRCVHIPGDVAATAANATSGLSLWRRLARSFTVPTFTGNAYMTYFRGYGEAYGPGVLMAALETTLGTLTISGNSFADGALMPTRIIGGGSSAQLSTLMPMMWVSTALTATTPVVTTTYKNQAGVAGQSCALTLPTNALINSAFAMAPHLASGDTGMQDISACSTSAGSAGVLKVVGLLPLGIAMNATSTMGGDFDFMANPFEMYPLVAGDVISFWAQSNLASIATTIAFQLQKEV